MSPNITKLPPWLKITPPAINHAKYFEIFIPHLQIRYNNWRAFSLNKIDLFGKKGVRYGELQRIDGVRDLKHQGEVG